MNQGNAATQASIQTCERVDPGDLHRFLQRMFSPDKAAFLIQHGDWWHRGPHNRWVLLVDGQIAGYSAIIPTQLCLRGQPLSAAWWVDLVIAPEYRGRGYQTLFDHRVRQSADLILGFPNALAARIHRVHGWGVRDDLQVRLLPLQPVRIKTIQRFSGVRRWLLTLAAAGLTPQAWLHIRALRRYTPRTARHLPEPDAAALAAISARLGPLDCITTDRTPEYLHWRYFTAPYFNQLTFYVAGPPAEPSHYLISRAVTFQGAPATRILDLYGPQDQSDTLQDLITLAIKDAALRGSAQVTALITLSGSLAIFKSLGFSLSSPSRFCWLTSDSTTSAALGSHAYWTLADSDNDAPE